MAARYAQKTQDCSAKGEEVLAVKTDYGQPWCCCAAESMTQMGTSEGTLVEREVNDSDFIKSSR
jgi:hypothetical protein